MTYSLPNAAQRWSELSQHLAGSFVQDLVFTSQNTIDRWAINFKDSDGELKTAWVDQPLVAGEKYNVGDLIGASMPNEEIDKYNAWVEDMNRKSFG